MEEWVAIDGIYRLEGFLFKHGEGLGLGFKKRWVYLEKGKLCYQKFPQSRVCLGTYDMATLKYVRSKRKTGLRVKPSVKDKFQFVVGFTEGEVLFRADSAEEREDWVRGICQYGNKIIHVDKQPSISVESEIFASQEDFLVSDSAEEDSIVEIRPDVFVNHGELLDLYKEAKEQERYHKNYAKELYRQLSTAMEVIRLQIQQIEGLCDQKGLPPPEPPSALQGLEFMHNIYQKSDCDPNALLNDLLGNSQSIDIDASPLH